MSRFWLSPAALTLAVVGGCLATLAGCGSSPATRFYTLATVPPVTKIADRSSTPQLGVGIRSVMYTIRRPDAFVLLRIGASVLIPAA